MLERMGAASLQSLFSDVPESLRFPRLELPPGCNEYRLHSDMQELAARNSPVADGHSFLGAGTYRHVIPAIVDDVLQRSEFYTSYTPYQPELSQGMLQATFEYQTMICRLTGMQVSNASHYDGATALAEAILMTQHVTRHQGGDILIAPGVNPAMLAVAGTYLQGGETQLRIADLPTGIDELAGMIDTNTAAVVVQYPDFFGALTDFTRLAKSIHDQGGLLIVVTDPVSLGLFQPPSAFGADIVVAEGQCLGLPTQFGGPGLGILATQKKYARQLPGRIVGETIDSSGNRSYVLTLATREQHIRRERATSNICTNAALSALASTVYLATLGKAGLKALATLCFQRAHYAAHSIGKLDGIKINPWLESDNFFREFVVELPQDASVVNHKLFSDYGIVGGYPLGEAFPSLSHCLLVSVTDINRRAQIDKLSAALARILQQ